MIETIAITPASPAAHELAVEFFRGIYGEHSVVPKEKMYDLPAYPCWALACHAYEKLVGIDPERAAARRLLGAKRQLLAAWRQRDPARDRRRLEHLGRSNKSNSPTTHNVSYLSPVSPGKITSSTMREALSASANERAVDRRRRPSGNRGWNLCGG
jgi:hypothetical protein